MAVEVKVKVEGMSCGHCKAAIEGALAKTAGVENAVVDLEAKIATVNYDPEQVELSVIKEKIEEQGFDVVG
ncbi:copper chaperone [Desulfitispora alkaliphila]|uniref:cation transporter n=1 Tax=Desulfitispora alkaliphila TaxID=622674 RepID=UPI003D1C87FA